MATNKSRDEDDKDKRFPERQISSPSAFSTAKTHEKSEEEKEKDEKQSETNDNLRKSSETPFADLGGVSSSERLLPSSTPIQDLPVFAGGARRVVPSTSREEDKPLEKTGAEAVPGNENKGRRGMRETGNAKEMRLNRLELLFIPKRTTCPKCLVKKPVLSATKTAAN